MTDPGPSTYVAAFDGKDALAELAGAEYLRRGGEHSRQVVALGDGAAWIRAMAEALYPHATRRLRRRSTSSCGSQPLREHQFRSAMLDCRDGRTSRTLLLTIHARNARQRPADWCLPSSPARTW